MPNRKKRYRHALVSSRLDSPRRTVLVQFVVLKNGLTRRPRPHLTEARLRHRPSLATVTVTVMDTVTGTAMVSALPSTLQCLAAAVRRYHPDPSAALAAMRKRSIKLLVTTLTKSESRRTAGYLRNYRSPSPAKALRGRRR
jgi:hypothetical protein